MRVISGRKKGRALQAVPGKNTRPTTDKVKESIFNMIGNMIGRHQFEGGLGLDLYAGTGGLGIEALSRGFDRFIFVDFQRAAVEVIKHNLQSLDLLSQCEVYRNDASRALKALAKRELRFDLIFLDPPYAKQEMMKQMQFIEDHRLLNEAGMIVAETDKKADLPACVGAISLWKQQQYGDTMIRIYVKEGGS